MLFGDKTEAFFDIWSIEHLMTGIVLGFILNKIFSSKKTNLLILLLLSCFWECLEHYLEDGLLGDKIQEWFVGTEYWGNRLVGDNLAILIGGMIFYKCPKSIYPAVALSLFFFILHLCFPTSMDLQNMFF